MNTELKAAQDKLQNKIKKEQTKKNAAEEQKVREAAKKQEAKKQEAKKQEAKEKAAKQAEANEKEKIETAAKEKFNKANVIINDPKTKFKSMTEALADMQNAVKGMPQEEQDEAQEKISAAEDKINKIKEQQQSDIGQAAQRATDQKQFKQIQQDAAAKNKSTNMKKVGSSDHQSDDDSVGHQDSNDSFSSDKTGKVEKKGLGQRFKEWLASKFNFAKKMVAKDNLEMNPKQAKSQLDQLISQAKQDYESKIEKLGTIKSVTKAQEKQIVKYGKQLKELSKGYRKIFSEDLTKQQKTKKPLNSVQFKLFGEIQDATDLNDFINDKEKSFGIAVKA